MRLYSQDFHNRGHTPPPRRSELNLFHSPRGVLSMDCRARNDKSGILNFEL